MTSTSSESRNKNGPAGAGPFWSGLLSRAGPYLRQVDDVVAVDGGGTGAASARAENVSLPV
jgi:hypothetical protein